MASLLAPLAQPFADALARGSRNEITLLFAGLMLAVTVACGVLSRLLSGVFVKSYRGLSAVDKWDWDTRIGSSIHAAASTALAVYVVATSGVVPGLGYPPLRGPASLFTSPLTHAAVGLSLGYFIADTFALVYYYPLLPHTNELMMHHLTCLACLAVAFFTRHGHMYIEMMVATEVTTPLINARWYLDKAGRKTGAAYKANGLAIVVAWFFGRICIFPPFAYHVATTLDGFLLMAPPAVVLTLLCPSLLAALNVMWFRQIVRGAIKMFTPKGDEHGEAKKKE